MVEIRRGRSDKPTITSALIAAIQTESQRLGQSVLYVGYPVLGSQEGPVTVDALLVSANFGLTAFDLVEGVDAGEYQDRQDAVHGLLTAKLIQNRSLNRGKRLGAEVRVITFGRVRVASSDDYPVADSPRALSDLIATWRPGAIDNYEAVLSTIQAVTSIRRGRKKRELTSPDSRGARLKALEEKIANLDSQQSAAVIETFDGVQRIRGLAGSGKTIVLALKVAYLYSQNPDWNIAVTFNSRSLKGQFQRLITGFIYEQANEEPDWTRVHVLHAWGSSGEHNDGMYYRFCRRSGATYLDYSSAKARFGQNDPFGKACEAALSSGRLPEPEFDAVLVDEAQDFAPAFLRMCLALTRLPHRLVYAYDELQNLGSASMPPPEELFGTDERGMPRVSFSVAGSGWARQDIILRKCYRNSKPVLTTAHALGFGIYRKKGLAQIFEDAELWGDVGYEIAAGELEDNKRVRLRRTEDSSPVFLESHSPDTDLLSVHSFESEAEQTAWVVDEIRRNIREDELRPEDILVINSDPITTRTKVGKIRSELLKQGIDSILAGVSHSPDIFEYEGSATFTGIYRAKGNEAGMVYVLNADYSADHYDIAWARNILFTAITRSKAWVRICGVGPRMKLLEHEVQATRDRGYALDFIYPDSERRAQMRVVNRDMTKEQRNARSRSKKEMKRILKEIEAGRLRQEDFSEFFEEFDRLRHKR